MSVAYLILTLYLFLTAAGIEVILLFAIFSYIFYTPLVAIFKYDIDEIVDERISKYIELVAYTLFAVLVVYSMNFFSAETFVKILRSIVSNVPSFKLPDFSTFFDGMSPLYILVSVIIALLLWVYILYIIAAILLFWILKFLFNLILGVVIIFLYILSSLAVLAGLIYIAYKGKQLVEPYIQNNFQRATIYFSTIISALYLIAVFYINMFTLS